MVQQQVLALAQQALRLAPPLHSKQAREQAQGSKLAQVRELVQGSKLAQAPELVREQDSKPALAQGSKLARAQVPAQQACSSTPSSDI